VSLPIRESSGIVLFRAFYVRVGHIFDRIIEGKSIDGVQIMCTCACLWNIAPPASSGILQLSNLDAQDVGKFLGQPKKKSALRCICGTINDTEKLRGVPASACADRSLKQYTPSEFKTQ
jgi:hypothetical protein